MEKKNNKKGLIALAVVLVLAIAALIIWQVNKPEPQQGGKEITVNVAHLNGDDTSYTITTDESKQEWWGYSVNGAFAELGVDSQPVADGDVYDFVLNVGW